MDFLLAFGIVVTLSLLAGRFLGPLGWMDLPEGRRQHLRPVPRTGGIALVIAGAIGLLIGRFNLPFTHGEMGLVLGMALIGAIDDRYNLRARWKALAGLVIAIVLAYWGANRLCESPHALLLLGAVPIPHHWITYFTLLLVAYWSLPQAFNLIDGANGLSIGYGILIMLVLWGAGSPNVFLLGLLSGLLVLNWPRAIHFLGDCGALTLGLVVALLSKKAVGVQSPDAILWIFAYPILDVSTVVLIRKLHGKPLGEGDRNHLHHQLQDRFPRLRHVAVPFLWLLAGTMAYGAIARGGLRIFPYLALAVLILLSVVFSFLTHLEDRDTLASQEPRGAKPPSRFAEKVFW